jgi:hypothetical protein
LRTDRARRIPVLAAIAALLVVGGLVDRVGEPAGASAPASPVIPSVAGSSALSSSWYCAGGTSGAGTQADTTLVVSNVGDSLLRGAITAVSSTGATASLRLQLGRRQQATVAQSKLLQGAYVADTVEMDGGQVVVSQEVSGPLGVSEAPCASSTSSTWYLGTGSTVQGDSVYLALYNPAATDAIADLSFATDHGLTEPGDYQGLLVPAGRLVVVDVGQRVQDDNEVATAVTTRIGRLVVDQLSERTSGGQALTLTLAAPSLASVWQFPFSVTEPDVAETFYLFNPSQQTAQIRMGFALASGAAEPLALSVPPQSQVSLEAKSQARIPPGTPYSAMVASQNGVPVLAARATDYGSSGSSQGRAEMTGTPVSSRAWVLPPAVGASQQAVGVTALGPGTVTVTVAGSSPGALPVSRRSLAPGRPATIAVPPEATLGNLPLVVTSTGPVVLERDQDHSNGVSAMLGMPPSRLEQPLG